MVGCLLSCRVCKIESVDGSNISAYYVHECDAVNRSGLRCRRFIFTGHVNGTVQVGRDEVSRGKVMQGERKGG